MTDRTILLATENRGKAERLQWVLDGFGFTYRDLRSLPPSPPPEENGANHEENATIKAVHWSALASGLAIASDGGVNIPALGKHWSGLLTRRATGAAATDEQRVRRLLELMEGRQGQERRVTWTEGLALAEDGRLLASWEVQGNEGILAEHYDPAHVVRGLWVETLWYYPQFGKLAWQLTPQEREAADTCWSTLRRRVQEYLRTRGA